jgi:hypothetical protein
MEGMTTHNVTTFIVYKIKLHILFFWKELKKKKKNLSKNALPPFRGEAADGICDFHRNVTVKLIACLLNF